jgi:hypothetical protein
MNGIRMRLAWQMARNTAGTAAFICAFFVVGPTRNCNGQALSQKTFASAQKATSALFHAIQDDDKSALTAILGARDVCSSDHEQAKSEREQFVEKYQQMRRLVQEPDGTTLLYIGAENWPFPFPLVSTKGSWRFDSAAGRREILYRRLGENETAAIQACRDLVAQTDQPASVSGSSPKLMYGYYFRCLNQSTHLSNHNSVATTVASNGSKSSQSAFVAYPAEYRSSGVMTFIVKQDGVVYAKDLGPKASIYSKSGIAPRPDTSWKVEN